MRALARAGTRFAADFTAAPDSYCRRRSARRAGPRGYPFKHAVPPPGVGARPGARAAPALSIAEWLFAALDQGGSGQRDAQKAGRAQRT
jgi:hypothetical protein